nr:hypothetical protein BaRGS_013847 [Batillaria attramentaria]
MEWELMNHSIKDNEGCVTTGISCAVVQLELRRRRFFYILNVILPVVFMSLTSSLVFALPADAGEKMGLSITVLLAYAVYLSLVTDAMPNTSMQASIMAVYLMLLLGLCAVNVVLIMAVYLMLLLGLCAVNVVLIMAVYLMLLLGLCAVNVVLTTFILRLHHRKDIVHIEKHDQQAIAHTQIRGETRGGEGGVDRKGCGRNSGLSAVLGLCQSVEGGAKVRP